MPLIRRATDFLNPQWGRHAPTPIARFVDNLVKATHKECDNAVCRHASFIYGSGFPTLWRHENLNDETHEWLSDEFANVPLTFFDQIGVCVQEGHLKSVEGHKELPEDFAKVTPKTDARVAFISGEKNDCFLPESQVKSFEHFNKVRAVVPFAAHLSGVRPPRHFHGKERMARHVPPHRRRVGQAALGKHGYTRAA